MNGFRIRQLILTGENIEEKSLSFELGLNLLTGPSNTGKTYVIQCIDFVLGRSKPPKKIKQSKGYEEVFLEIEEYATRKVSVISRSLISSKSFFYENKFYKDIEGVIPKPLDEKKENRNISSLLLEISGFKEPIKIKKNKDFVKVNFTFRIFSPFILVKEEDMILERSPIYTGSYTDRTLCFNSFKFILSGKDDSSIMQMEKKDIWTAKKNANIDLLNKLLEEERIKLNALLEKKQEQPLNSIDEDSVEKIRSIQNDIYTLNNNISESEKVRHKIKADLTYNKNLQHKFELLKQQYLSDIERLDFINEGSFLLEQLSVTKCPHCGEIIDGFEKHIHKDIDIKEVSYACDFEINKIKNNIFELEKSYRTVNYIIEGLQEDIVKINDRISSLKSKLKDVLQPKLINLQKQWDNKLEYELVRSEIESLKSNIENLKSMMSNTHLSKHHTNENNDKNTIEMINKSAFTTMLSKNLKKCLFNSDKTLQVEFLMNNDRELDFLINGEGRETFGKGYRSIITSIFHLTVLMYCKEKKLPHSNLVILDSPVNAFKDIASNEKLPESAQNRFFEFVFGEFKHEQVIIIENDSVIEELLNEIHLQEFTGDISIGRYGFY